MIAPFVDSTALDRLVDDAAQRAVVVDTRWYLDGRSGAEAFAAGHIPGAVFVELDRWLAGPPSAAAGRHPLPDPEVFAAGMSAAGIGDTSIVVAYDDAGGVIASRLV
ncbi:rhodanese-like domain-containing protein [Microcella sp.]|uniref:sulfurtransferase n=1 Tax=Microcella sp. TaxID=1913979 RepID=UPI00299F586A|nr:rhodanese-like domain-containing protein [Microcella sp.]MDX2026424.1 rhodanese-like domain-containing protein [Microcella sp.]